VDVDRATRLARVTERMGADPALSRAARESRLRRVQDAWLRDLSRSALAAASRELRLERARIDGAERLSGPRSLDADVSDGIRPAQRTP